ncbi:MAG: PEP-CTERM sorting domain-containing protein [Fuerstiella sp.]
MKIIRFLSRFAATVACAGILNAGTTQAGVITDRTALRTLLGGPGIIEDFESIGHPGTIWGGSVLNSETTQLGGPGLVVPGVSFISQGNTIFRGAGEAGAPSAEISGNGGLTYVVDFTVPVIAFGMDVREASDFPQAAEIQVFGPDDASLLGTIAFDPIDRTPVFAGFHNPSGIGRVELTTIQRTSSGGAPSIDNLEFAAATAVPEPSSLALLSIGLSGALLIRRTRRRFDTAVS